MLVVAALFISLSIISWSSDENLKFCLKNVFIVAISLLSMLKSAFATLTKSVTRYPINANSLVAVLSYAPL